MKIIPQPPYPHIMVRSFRSSWCSALTAAVTHATFSCSITLPTGGGVVVVLSAYITNRGANRFRRGYRCDARHRQLRVLPAVSAQ
jgi:hypothetical protein